MASKIFDDKKASAHTQKAILTTEQLEPWVTIEKISKHLGVKADTIYKWIEREKGLPVYKVGRLWRFKLSEVELWVRNGGSKEANTNKRSKRPNKPK